MSREVIQPTDQEQVYGSADDVVLRSRVAGDVVDRLRILSDGRVLRSGQTSYAPPLGQRLSTRNLFADGTAAALTFSTPDGGGHITHPSVLHFPDGWNGYRWWMAATPYDGTSIEIENPCIYASNDGVTWAAPDGLTNPLDPYPGGGVYNADTHLSMGPDGLMYVFWIKQDGGTSVTTFYYRASSDGVTWGTKVAAITLGYSPARLVSPAINWDGTQWVLYAVNITPSPNTVVRTTCSTLTGTWSTATAVTSLTTDSGYEPWHLDARRLSSGQWLMLILDGVIDGTGGLGRLKLYTSDDGQTWTTTGRAVVPEKSPWTTQNYRSSMVPIQTEDGLGLQIYYAGINGDPNWNIGTTLATARDRDSIAITSMLAGAKGLGVYKGDDFTRSDGAIGTSSSGLAWSTLAGSPDIVSNRARASTAVNTKAVIDLSATDHYIEFTVPVISATSNDQFWVIARVADTSNHYRWGYTVGTSSQVQLQKVVAGSATALYSISNTARWVPVAGDRWGLLCIGSTITPYLNGQALGSVTDSALSAGTKVGFQAQNTTVRFSSLWARTMLTGQLPY